MFINKLLKRLCALFENCSKSLESTSIFSFVVFTKHNFIVFATKMYSVGSPLPPVHLVFPWSRIIELLLRDISHSRWKQMENHRARKWFHHTAPSWHRRRMVVGINYLQLYLPRCWSDRLEWWRELTGGQRNRAGRRHSSKWWMRRGCAYEIQYDSYMTWHGEIWTRPVPHLSGVPLLVSHRGTLDVPQRRVPDQNDDHLHRICKSAASELLDGLTVTLWICGRWDLTSNPSGHFPSFIYGKCEK